MAEATVSLTPYLCCRNAAEAVEFYQKAFDAEPLMVQKMPDGRVMHATMTVHGANFYLSEEFPDHGALSPLALGGSPVTMHLQVPNCDEVFQRAVDAGCTVRMPLQDMFWGDRYGALVDPFGHHWGVATTIRQVSPEELQQAVASFG